MNSVARGKLCAPEAPELVFWFFAVNLEYLFPLFACDEISLLKGIEDAFKSPKVYPASSALALECHHLLAEVPPRFDLDHRGQLLRVVARILTPEFNSIRHGGDGSGRAHDHIGQVFEQLSTSEILSLRIGDLAKRCGCSRRHLNRLFHQHLGFSVSAFRMETRLLKALSLLRDRDVKVMNVAEQCGFNHLGQFNTCFRRRFGVSPGEWRKGKERAGDPAAENVRVPAQCSIKGLGLCPWAAERAAWETSTAGSLPQTGGARRAAGPGQAGQGRKDIVPGHVRPPCTCQANPSGLKLKIEWSSAKAANRRQGSASGGPRGAGNQNRPRWRDRSRRNIGP
jgi:AraC-like DNA-binding protein